MQLVNKMEAKITKIYSFIFMAVIVVFYFFSNTALAQTPEIDQKLNETKAEVQKLADIKDKIDISDEEKGRLEIESKKKIILDVIEVSVAQVKDLESKFLSSSFSESDEWKAIKEEYTKKISSYFDFYKEEQDKINKGDLDLTKIKEIAKEIESKKIQEIDLGTKEINNIVIFLSISDILKLADQRIDKVGADVSKIYDKRLAKSNILRDWYADARSLVFESHKFNDSFKEVIVNLYGIDKTIANQEFISKLMSDLKYKQEIAKSRYDSDGNLIIKTDDQLIDEYLESLTVGSLNKIKMAYDVFVKMSVNVKEYLK